MAAALLHELAVWSLHHGAERLYLQVERENTAAQALFAGAGLVPSHTYHYRSLPASPIDDPQGRLSPRDILPTWPRC